MATSTRTLVSLGMLQRNPLEIYGRGHYNTAMSALVQCLAGGLISEDALPGARNPEHADYPQGWWLTDSLEESLPLLEEYEIHRKLASNGQDNHEDPRGEERMGPQWTLGFSRTNGNWRRVCLCDIRHGT